MTGKGMGIGLARGGGARDIINLQKASRIWYCLSSILGREGSNPKTSGNFYLAVVQVILIFGLEMWVVTPRIG